MQLNRLPKGDGRARQEIGVELPFGSGKRPRLEGLVGPRWSWSQGSWFLGISGSALKCGNGVSEALASISGGGDGGK